MTTGDPESTPLQGTNEVIEVKEKVRSQVKEAKTTEAKQELVDQTVEELKLSITPAKEFVTDEALAQMRRVMPSKRAEGRTALIALVKAAELAKQGLPVAEGRSQTLLMKLADISLTASTASAIVSFLGDYFTGEKTILFSTAEGEKTDFEKDLETLSTTNPLAAGLIIDSIKKNIGDFGVTKEKALQLEAEIEKLRENMQELSLPSAPSYENQQLWESLNKKISNLLEADLKKEADQRLTAQERFDITRFYWTGQGEISESTLQKLGLTGRDIEEYRRLHQVIFHSGDLERIMYFVNDLNLRRFLTAAHREFSIDILEKKKIIVFERPDDKDDKGRMVSFNLKAFKKMISKYYFDALQPVHNQKNVLFQQAMGTGGYQYYFGGLQGIIKNFCDNLESLVSNNPALRESLIDIKGRYQGSILTYAETFHNLPIYAKDATSFEKWPQFLGYLYPSELAEIFDPDDRIMEMARQEIAMHIRKRVALNNNRIPSDLFSGFYDDQQVRYGIEDMRSIRRSLEERVKQLKAETGEEVEEWEIDRALTYAVGVGLASLIDPEIVSTADPSSLPDPGFKGVYPLAAIVSAKHNWGLGRGYPGATVFPHLLAMDVTLFPEQQGFLRRLFKRKKWVPPEFDNFARGKEAEYGTQVFNQLLDRTHQYQHLLSMLNIAASLNSRHGWRVSPLKEILKDLSMGKYTVVDEQGNRRIINLDKSNMSNGSIGWGTSEWRDYFDLSMSLYGTASLWWQSDDRVDGEMKRFLAKFLRHETISDHEYEEYKLGEKALQRIFKVKFDGQERKITFAEFWAIKQYQIRGETFYRYLKRNPGDFLMLLAQCSPELLSSEDFDGNEKVKSRLLHIWGTKGYQKLQAVRSWIFNQLVEGYVGKEIDGKKMTKDDYKIIIDYFVKQSGTAFERMLRDVTQEFDSKGRPLPKRRRNSLKPNDFTDPVLRELIFGKKGLYSILTEESCGGFDNKGTYDAGDQKFFYHMGEIWTLKQGNVNPFAADINHFELYKYIGKVGEDVAKRYLGDTQAVTKLIGELSHLDERLLHAAESKDLKDIFEIHKTLWSTLKNIIGLDYAERANYILAQIVTQFFWEHSDTRIPFLRSPLNLPLRWLLGKNISLSRIISHNIHAMSWGQNDARDYFMRLAHELHVIPVEGLWSKQQLESAFNVKMDTFIFGDLAPSLIYYLIAYLLWVYIRKALQEAEGKKT